MLILLSNFLQFTFSESIIEGSLLDRGQRGCFRGLDFGDRHILELNGHVVRGGGGAGPSLVENIGHLF